MKTEEEMNWLERLQFYGSDLTKTQALDVAGYAVWQKSKINFEELDKMKAEIDGATTKSLLSYLRRETKGDTEFRLVVHPDGKAYIHVLGRDSETLNFEI